MMNVKVDAVYFSKKNWEQGEPRARAVVMNGESFNMDRASSQEASRGIALRSDGISLTLVVSSVEQNLGGKGRRRQGEEEIAVGSVGEQLPISLRHGPHPGGGKRGPLQ